nr:DUF4865 family protein [Tatumella morbirosei]
MPRESLPVLLFKSWLYRCLNQPLQPGAHNCYAPLYAWENSEAMNAFLTGPLFAAAVNSFGWPDIRYWLSLRVPQTSLLGSAKYLSVTTRPLAHDSDLSQLPLSGQLAGWDISRRELLNVAFTDSPQPQAENYCIGYISQGALVNGEI